MYVDTDCNDQDSEYAEVDDGVNQNGDPARHHISKLHHPRSCRYLKQQSRRQQDEQNHRHHHRTPVSTHLPLSGGGMEIVKRRGGTEINISNKPNRSCIELASTPMLYHLAMLLVLFPATLLFNTAWFNPRS